MNVYLVFYGYKDDKLKINQGEFISVFSTRTKAEQYIKDHENGLLMKYWIQEVSVK